MNHYFLFLLGLVIISLAAELMLRGASKIASLLGIKPIVIGMTVISIGTSLPELAVGIAAINDGAADMAIGNIAGTNLVNILLILGLSALIRPLPLSLNSVKTEIFVMMFSAILLLVLCVDGVLTYWDGILMLICGILYMVIIIKNSKKESPEILKEYSEEYEPSNKIEKQNTSIWLKNGFFLVFGIIFTIWGADLLVDGAISIAQAWGFSEAVIGLTIVAIGTSAPELVTTIIATLKNDRDVAIGNLLGSSITNILFILGTTCLVATDGLNVTKGILWFDLPLAALVAIVCYPVFRSGQRMSRLEGLFFVLSYIVYILFMLYYRV